MLLLASSRPLLSQKSQLASLGDAALFANLRSTISSQRHSRFNRILRVTHRSTQWAPVSSGVLCGKDGDGRGKMFTVSGSLPIQCKLPNQCPSLGTAIKLSTNKWIFRKWKCQWLRTRRGSGDHPVYSSLLSEKGHEAPRGKGLTQGHTDKVILLPRQGCLQQVSRLTRGPLCIVTVFGQASEKQSLRRDLYKTHLFKRVI